MQKKVTKQKKHNKDRLKYNVEFFHIYADEEISPVHTKSIDYLKSAAKAWDVDATLSILIDDYNSKAINVVPESVYEYLKNEGMAPHFWAYESDMIGYVHSFLESMTDKHTLKGYKTYISQHNKFPCSLLTTVWYLVRLGVFEPSIIHSFDGVSAKYQTPDRLISILPEQFRTIEEKVVKNLKRSKYKEYADKIQALFYSTEIDRKIELY